MTEVSYVIHSINQSLMMSKHFFGTFSLKIASDKFMNFFLSVEPYCRTCYILAGIDFFAFFEFSIFREV